MQWKTLLMKETCLVFCWIDFWTATYFILQKCSWIQYFLTCLWFQEMKAFHILAYPAWHIILGHFQLKTFLHTSPVVCVSCTVWLTSTTNIMTYDCACMFLKMFKTVHIMLLWGVDDLVLWSLSVSVSTVFTVKSPRIWSCMTKLQVQYLISNCHDSLIKCVNL